MSPTRSTRRRASLVGLAAFGAALAASTVHCAGHSSTGGGGTSETIPSLRDVVFQGTATDEAAFALVNTAAVTDPQLSATFTYPSDGAVVSSSPPPTFAWQSALASVELPGARRSRYTRNDAPPSHHPVWPVIFGVREAYAHGTPMSGPGYFIRFTTPANPQVLRVFTSNTTYTPDATALAKLKAAGGPINASITNALFTENRIAMSGGPYQGATITFTIQ